MNDLDLIKQDLDRLTQLAYELRIRNLENCIEKLMIAGRATSNCCYNVGQQGGRVLNARDANSLCQAAQDWDSAINEVRKLK